MPASVKSLIIERFRSIPSERVDFDNPTFLVGRNGSGKSNFVDIFAFLAEAMVSPLQAVFDKRGGIEVVRNRPAGRSRPPNVGLGVVFGELNGNASSGQYSFEVRALPNYGFEVLREQCLVTTREGRWHWFDRIGSEIRSSISELKPSPDPPSLMLPLVGGDARFAPVWRALAGMRTYQIEPGRLRDMQDPDSGMGLRSDGSNAASVLQEIERRSPEEISRICQLLAAVVPNTTEVSPIKHGNKVTLRFTQEWPPSKRLRFEAFNMSDGTLRAVGLLTAIYQHPVPTLLAIEEPEATIHPGALGAIMDLLRHASRRTQVVVTTHSPEVLDAEWIEDKHLRIVECPEGATRIARVSDASRQALQGHLMGAGELLRSNALDPQPLFVESMAPQQHSLFEDLQ